jgi:cell division protein FtsI/penicillin-binding protein 2
MGTSKFRDYFLGLQIGNKTGIDLPGETEGLVSNLHSPRKIEYATASYGQGIATTPIGTIRALASLASGGKVVTPHLARSIVYENGEVETIDPPEPKQVFSSETTETVSRMLVTVVDEALAGGNVALPHYTVAAKTGTAQMADPNGGYYDDRYFHSFFGYFPAYDPRFIVLLYTVEPKGVRYASETLTDPFMDITSFLLNYYQVPPDR